MDRIGIIGVNGTGKTTLLDVVSERIGFDGDVSPFTKANGYKIAYLTQEPELMIARQCLIQSCHQPREMALIREYEPLWQIILRRIRLAWRRLWLRWIV